MTVIELIEKLQTMPLNAEVLCADRPTTDNPMPYQEWDDDSENYVIVL